MDWLEVVKNWQKFQIRLEEKKKKKIKREFCKMCKGDGIVRNMKNGEWYKCKNCE